MSPTSRFKSERLEPLKRSVQALAQPGRVQMALFPDGVAKGDELMIDFDSALREARPYLEETATPQQKEAVQRLDDYTEQISGMHHEELWFDERTLLSDPRWEKVRALAKDVLSAFGWENTPPPMDDRIYILGE